MKFLLALIGFVVLASQGTDAVRATLEELKAFEKFSPYPWTQWLKFHPGSAVAIASSPGQLSVSSPDAEETEEDEEEDAEASDEVTADDLQTWFKRATLPEAKPDKAALKAEKDKAKLTKKAQKLADAALGVTKKPLLDIEPDFWGPPPSIAPNVTVPPPPGYWASKKALFISKLFAALADSVLNTTGPPTPVEVTTTTQSPRQALLEELNNVLLNDVARSAPMDTESDESDESEDSEEDSDEVAAIVSPVTPASAPTLSSAIAAKPAKPTKAPSAWAWGKPTKPTKAPKKKASKKLKGKKGAAVAADSAPASPGLDYDKLAKALLANGAAPAPKAKKV